MLRRSAIRLKLQHIILIYVALAPSCAYNRNFAKYNQCKLDDCFKIDNVPFIAQKENYCGPAALAMVMNYYGGNISQEEIAEEIYQPELKGTLSIQLALYPLQKGFEVNMYSGSFSDLQEKIRARLPLIVSLKEDSSKDKVHYMVVWGYDEISQQVFVHSSNKMSQSIAYETFMNMWENTGYLTVCIYPATEKDTQTFALVPTVFSVGTHYL